MSNDATTMLGMLFEQADPEEFINFRLIRVDGTAVKKFLPASDISAAAEWALMRREAGNLYVGVLPRTRESGGRDAIRQAGVVWADCDSPEAIAALEAFPLQPSMVVRSGSGENAHAYWLLEKPVDLDRVERVNKGLAAALGGDHRVHDAPRILRVPGTLNHKHEPPTDVQLVTSNDTRYAVTEIEAEAPPIATPRPKHSTKGGAQAALAEISPTERVLALLRGVRETGSGWMAQCPAHDDENPSLSVAEAEDGKVLLNCFKDCGYEAIVAALRLNVSDLFPDDDDHHDDPSLARTLVRIAEDSDVGLFHDSAGITYARVPVEDHDEVWTVTSRRFKRWLRFELRRRHDRMAAANPLNEAVEMLSAQADFDGPEKEVKLRSSWVPGGFVYNLADPDGNVVTVTPEGWTVDVDGQAMFLRRASVQPLPTPVRGGSIDLLRRYVNVEAAEDFMLIVAWLLMALRPSGPYPVLVVQGQQGSAKSTLTRVLKALVDPVKAPLRSVPGSLRDLAITADSNAVLALDNISLLKDPMSDAFCRLATGGGFSTRALYTDDEERVFEQMRPVILNGLDAIVTRQDLLGRSIVIRLPRISEDNRMDEDTFWAHFNADLPKILGALFQGASTALAEWETAPTGGLRMADFARWTAAAVPTFGWTATDVLTAYKNNLSGALTASLEGSLLATAVMKLIKPGTPVIEGEPTVVRQALRAALNDEESKSGEFPKNAQSMSRTLTLLTAALAEVGIEVTMTKQGSGNAKTRWIIIRGDATAGRGTHGTQTQSPDPDAPAS